MTAPLILVTGATGATGGFAIDQLLAKGARLRALVRQDDERADKLRAKGVEIVTGDLLDAPAMARALRDVYSAYFVYPLKPYILAATTYFAQAAHDAGVSAIVNISQRTARQDAVSNNARNHWFSERVFDWSPVPVTHLRPTLFMEWLLYPFQRPIIARHDALMLPGGEGRHSTVSAYDQGRVIATILMNPEPHAGKTYGLYGPQELSYSEIAAEISKVVGRQIKYVPESIAAFSERLAKVGVDEYTLQHLGAVFQDYQDNMLNGTGNAIEEITGVPPMSIAEFAKQHIDELR